jgi:CheY-like chemotaxis protein
MKSILLIEDSRFLRLTAERALIRGGYNVVSTGDGGEALQMARQRVPDLILLDMLLPTISGPEILRILKQDPATASVPVVVLSSLPQKNEEKLMHEGAIAYFEKSKLELDKSSAPLLQVVGDALHVN